MAACFEVKLHTDFPFWTLPCRLLFLNLHPWSCSATSDSMASVSSHNNIALVALKKQSKHSKLQLPSFGFNHLKSRRFKGTLKHASYMKDVSAILTKPEIDFKDPNWKRLIEEDFSKQFSLPHLNDILDLKPRPTTFTPKSRYFCFNLQYHHISIFSTYC